MGMRVLNIHDKNDVRLDPRNPPDVGDHDVVVNVKACGICGSDLTYIKIGGINRPEGGVTPIGHEAAGDVAAVGTAVQGVTVGQRVIINPMETSTFIGNGGPEGAFSEAVLVGNARLGEALLPIPNDVPYEIAALAEPLAVALHGVNQANVKPGDKVVVFGCGPIGLGMVIWLIDRGITDVVAVDLAPERLARAKALGAKAVIHADKEDLHQRLIEEHGSGRVSQREVVGTDAFLDAAGAPNIPNDVIRMAKHKAKLVVSAVYLKPVEINLGTMLSAEMILTTAAGYPTEMPEVVAALSRLKDKATALISHRYKFDDVLEALNMAGTPQSAKVMIEFEGAPV
jgi:(R,R)-butanediol dehydrogenase / meso-butanediol dehydrogenase / diacetyl reductase